MYGMFRNLYIDGNSNLGQTANKDGRWEREDWRTSRQVCTSVVHYYPISHGNH
jgi:hypothetical protein